MLPNVLQVCVAVRILPEWHPRDHSVGLEFQRRPSRWHLCSLPSLVSTEQKQRLCSSSRFNPRKPGLWSRAPGDRALDAPVTQPCTPRPVQMEIVSVVGTQTGVVPGDRMGGSGELWSSVHGIGQKPVTCSLQLFLPRVSGTSPLH